MKRFILTGAPGSGKTSLIRSLEMKGYEVVEEAATDVISYHQSMGIEEPWGDSKFINDILKIQQQRQTQAQETCPLVQFYDHSPLCTYALDLYLGFEPPRDLEVEIRKPIDSKFFEKYVLFIQNPGFIQNTEARRISFEETLKFEVIYLDVYQKFSYDISNDTRAFIDRKNGFYFGDIMRKFFGILLAFLSLEYASADCLLIVDINDDRTLVAEGDCDSRHTPCCTFKIPLSLMGYEKAILIDESHPEFSFKKGYVAGMPSWRRNETPKSWMKNGCVWYSQVLTEKLGMETFSKYVKEFDYGNKDVSGDQGKNNGLKRAWLSSSLRISPWEQVEFLRRFLQGQLLLSERACDKTKRILFIETLKNGWKLYGKTGAGYQNNADGTKNPNKKIGWFIGWIQKGTKKLIFACFIEEDKRTERWPSLRARKEIKERLEEVLRSFATNKG